MSTIKIFYDVDDYCKKLEKSYKQKLIGEESPEIWPSRLSMSEVMTIIILYHKTGRFRNFKSYYTRYVSRYLNKVFPDLVSYTRFIELMKMTVLPLTAFLNSRKVECSGISFIDSTKIVICHNKRIKSNKIFSGLAEIGKSTMGWFYGFKLHLIINDKGEVLSYYITPANVDDRQPVSKMTDEFFGKLFGDKGYISQKLFEKLFKRGLQLVTPIKKNMKNKLMPMVDKILLRKRSIIETINDQFKYISEIDHTRHRSVFNFMVNIVAGIIAYTYREKLLSIKYSSWDIKTLNS